jgi:inositol oxygenase
MIFMMHYFIISILLSFFMLESTEEHFRIYDETTPSHVKEFYRLNHENQTLAFVLEKENQYLHLTRNEMVIWEAIDLFDTLVDESDPDLDLPQRYHMFQTAEAIRKDGHPRWLILTGFLHDLGKLLALYGEPQWAVVGDTFPVGCRYSDQIVFPKFFEKNPDFSNPEYQTLYGIYSPHCGLDNVHMSWGHDEYLYHVLKDYLPEEAAYVIRFHSFYAAHQKNAYPHLMNAYDHQMMEWVRCFSHYDLYSKSDELLDIESLMPFYQKLVAEFFPDTLSW